MSIARRDYLLRMIEQFAAALARIAGARNAGKLDEATRLVRETADGILGPMRPMLDGVDAASAATLLGSADKTRIYAALTAEEAAIAEARGDAKRARSGHRRALELYLEATNTAPTQDPTTRDATRALRGKVDEARLAERYRKILAAID